MLCIKKVPCHAHAHATVYYRTKRWFSSSGFAEPPAEPTFALLGRRRGSGDRWPCISAGGSKLDGFPDGRRRTLQWHCRGSLAPICVVAVALSSIRGVLFKAMAGRGVLGLSPEVMIQAVVFGGLFRAHGSDAVQRTVVAAGIGRVACGL